LHPKLESPGHNALVKRIITNLMVNNADFAIRLTSPKFLLPEVDVRRLFLSGAVDVLEHSNVDLVLNPSKFEGDEPKPFTKVSDRAKAVVLGMPH